MRQGIFIKDNKSFEIFFYLDVVNIARRAPVRTKNTSWNLELPGQWLPWLVQKSDMDTPSCP